MVCTNPSCRADVRPEDAFCARCGTPAAGAGIPGPHGASPLGQASALHSEDLPRPGAGPLPRVPYAGRGEAYPALRQRAQVAIAGGGVIRWLVTGLGCVFLVVAIVAGVQMGRLAIGVLVGLVALAIASIVGWWLWVRLAVFGETIYLVLDLADLYRRRDSH